MREASRSGPSFLRGGAMDFENDNEVADFDAVVVGEAYGFAAG